MSRPAHEPVLRDRVVDLLAETEGGVIVDATVGAGGHARALLEASPDAHLVGLDRDPDALELAAAATVDYARRRRLVHAGYEDLAEIVGPVAAVHGPVRAVLYDLGVSSMQLDRGDRGFSFAAEASLDMRMDPHEGQSAADLVNSLDADALTRILREGGEDRRPRRIARAIVAARPLHTTTELADVVAAAVPASARRRTHPATRTFQALRIAVNSELERFSASLPQALELLAPAASARRGGRIAVIAYHSGEDRIAKQRLAEAAQGCICPPDLPVCGCGREPSVRLLTRGAVMPSAEETATNPRARSARLRAAERTTAPYQPVP